MASAPSCAVLLAQIFDTKVWCVEVEEYPTWEIEISEDKGSAMS